ncbi:MAG: Crp/Fnr family transcriptional regulator [Dehalococcoidales bacterium]|nr:Crp/Fnr family transcriptional regulator [Dehalococcoidales bacterium]
MAIQTEFLRKLPYFSGLDSSAIEAVTKYVFEKKAERGERLALEEEPSHALYFVVSGVVKVFRTSADGREQILRLIRPGECFNEVPVFSGSGNLASAQAMSPVVLYGIRKKDLETIIQTYPQVAMNIIQVLSRRIQELVMLVEDFSFRHVSGRLAKILLKYVDHAVATGGMKLTQQEMASMAGTAREVVGRALKSLETEGAIRIERNRIVVTDRRKLEAIAGLY